VVKSAIEELGGLDIIVSNAVRITLRESGKHSWLSDMSSH
jgi:hypothetical protein